MQSAAHSVHCIILDRVADRDASNKRATGDVRIGGGDTKKGTGKGGEETGEESRGGRGSFLPGWRNVFIIMEPRREREGGERER